MVMKLNPEQLSSYKKNIIRPRIGDVHVGEVVAVMDEYGDGVYNCTVDVFPEARALVIKSMTAEAEKLKNGS